jgi:hypothetical protein
MATVEHAHPFQDGFTCSRCGLALREQKAVENPFKKYGHCGYGWCSRTRLTIQIPGFRARDILDVLNGRSYWRVEKDRRDAWYHALSAEFIEPSDPPPILSGVPHFAYSIAHIEIWRSLRHLVDYWVDSGVYPSGEMPHRRRLSVAPMGMFENPITLWPTWPDSVNRQAQPGLLLDCDALLVNRPDGDLKAYANRYANFLFAVMILTGRGFQICKCRYSLCGIYFESKRVKHLYPRGTFCCPEHNRLDSATKLTAERRKLFKQSLMELAGVKLLEWTAQTLKWQERNGPMKTWLVSQLNTYIQRDPRWRRHRIKQNWLTWNWAEIESEVAKLTS